MTAPVKVIMCFIIPHTRFNMHLMRTAVYSVKVRTLIERFMGPTWSPSGADRTDGPHVGPMNFAIWGIDKWVQTFAQNENWWVKYMLLFLFLPDLWYYILFFHQWLKYNNIAYTSEFYVSNIIDSSNIYYVHVFHFRQKRRKTPLQTDYGTSGFFVWKYGQPATYHQGHLLLTFIPSMISNHMSSKLWDEITYPVPNINGWIVEVFLWIHNFTPHFILLRLHILITHILTLKKVVFQRGPSTFHTYMSRGESPFWKHLHNATNRKTSVIL